MMNIRTLVSSLIYNQQPNMKVIPLWKSSVTSESIITKQEEFKVCLRTLMIIHDVYFYSSKSLCSPIYLTSFL